MMKQPAENPNATPLEEKLSAERVDPVRDPAEEQQEIESEARRLAAQEGKTEWTDEIWDHASKIVRNRKTSLSKA